MLDILDSLERSESSEEEPVETTRLLKKRQKTGRKEVYECADCEYSTLYWCNMKTHRDKHDRNEKFKCDLCSFSAARPNYVSIHLKRCHRNPPSEPLEASY